MVTNLYPLVKNLHRHRCAGDHQHQWLINGRAADAAKYTTPSAQAILKALHHHLQASTAYVMTFEEPQDSADPALPLDLHTQAASLAKSMAQVFVNQS